MALRPISAILALSLLLPGCSCGRPGPQPPDPSTSGTTGSTAETADTAAQPPCATPEAEPNDDGATANVLPLERWACGLVDDAGDADWWTFDHDDEGWLQVEVDAADGSFADMTFILEPAAGGWSASRDDDSEAADTTLLFPAPAGGYSLRTREQTASGGERYGYELLVSEAKPPVEWTRTEVEPNGTGPTALPIFSGDAVFGEMFSDSPVPDFDYFVIAVPAGPHTVTVDVDAFDHQSAQDVDVQIRDADLAELKLIKTGGTGALLDPLGAYSSSGSEFLYFQVLQHEADDVPVPRGSPAHWYVLTVTVEAL
jgi:hypothetical protein